MKQRGFTLIESMVAVSILAIAMGGPLYAASRAILAADIARDKLVASYLAQEAVEAVRKDRDDQYIALYQGLGAGQADNAWSIFGQRMSNFGCTTSCAVDVGSPVPGVNSYQACSEGSVCSQLYLRHDSSPDRFTYTHSSAGATASAFKRIVKVSMAGDSADVVSKVTWDFAGQPHSVEISDHLTKWQP